MTIMTKHPLTDLQISNKYNKNFRETSSFDELQLKVVLVCMYITSRFAMRIFLNGLEHFQLNGR